MGKENDAKIETYCFQMCSIRICNLLIALLSKLILLCDILFSTNEKLSLKNLLWECDNVYKKNHNHSKTFHILVMLNLMNQILAIKFRTSKVRHMEDYKLSCGSCCENSWLFSDSTQYHRTPQYLYCIYCLQPCFPINTVSTHLTNVEKSLLWLD